MCVWMCVRASAGVFVCVQCVCVNKWERVWERVQKGVTKCVCVCVQYVCVNKSERETVNERMGRGYKREILNACVFVCVSECEMLLH